MITVGGLTNNWLIDFDGGSRPIFPNKYLINASNGTAIPNKAAHHIIGIGDAKWSRL
jgi:hypothetical protein